MPYVVVPAGEDLTLLNNIIEPNNLHVLLWGVAGTRRVYGVVRSQRVGHNRIKQNPLAGLKLYQRSGLTWYQVVF